MSRALVTAILLLSCAFFSRPASSETFRHAASGIECPDELAGFTRTGVQDFESRQPGLGVACKYQFRNELFADVYIYTGGVANVPSDISHPLIARIREQTLREIAQAAETRGEQAHRGTAATLSVQTGQGPVAVYYDTLTISSAGPTSRNTFLWLWTARNHVLKIRMTVPGSGSLDLRVWQGFYEAVVRLAAAPLAGGTGKEELIVRFLNIRENLARGGKIDVAEMSKSIREAIKEGERLEREGNYKDALGKLLELERFAPLADLPSFDVQMLSSWLYGKLGDADRASAHRARADAMRELLGQRIGKGDAPADPVRALMISDVTEWARMRLARIADVRSAPFQGREVMAVTYSGPSTGGQPRVAYFEVDPRVRARAMQRIRLYDPIPLAGMPPKGPEYFELAKQKRARFLSDSFAYSALIVKIREVIRKAATLDGQGKPLEALAALAGLRGFEGSARVK